MNLSDLRKPKHFHESLYLRLTAGTKARIDRLRGGARQGDYVRELLEAALVAQEG